MGKHCLRVSTQGTMFQRPPRLYFVLVARLGGVRITQVVLALEA